MGFVGAILAAVLRWPPAVVGLTLLFFFIVFYGNSSYQRFYTLYGHCVGIGGTTMEWVSLVKAHSVGLDEPALSTAQWNTTRYILAAAHILYYALHGDSISEDEWQMMGARELLSAGELEVLKAYKGFKPFLAVSWGLDAAKAMCAQTGERDNGWSSWQFREVAFKFRGHCGQIINLLKQPVPFPYFHLLNVIMLLQLLLLSYALAGFPLIAPYFSTTIIGFSTVVLLGMRGLAVQLSNPFGNDAVDFEIEKFMLGSYSNAVAHLRSADIVLDVFDLPPKMRNPLSPTLTSKDEKAIKLAWEKSPEDVGQIKDDDRIFSDGFVNMFSGATKGLTDTMSNAATGAVSTASNACSNTMQAGTTVMSSSIGDMSSSDDKGGGTIAFPTRAASCGGMPEGATTFVEKSTNPLQRRGLRCRRLHMRSPARSSYRQRVSRYQQPIRHATHTADGAARVGRVHARTHRATPAAECGGDGGESRGEPPRAELQPVADDKRAALPHGDSEYAPRNVQSVRGWMGGREMCRGSIQYRAVEREQF